MHLKCSMQKLLFTMFLNKLVSQQAEVFPNRAFAFELLANYYDRLGSSNSGSIGVFPVYLEAS